MLFDGSNVIGWSVFRISFTFPHKGKTDLEKERDNNVMRTRKLQKQVEKLQVSLGEARQTITELKSQLLENSNLKVRSSQNSNVNCWRTAVLR